MRPIDADKMLLELDCERRMSCNGCPFLRRDPEPGCAINDDEPIAKWVAAQPTVEAECVRNRRWIFNEIGGTKGSGAFTRTTAQRLKELRLDHGISSPENLAKILYDRTGFTISGDSLRGYEAEEPKATPGRKKPKSSNDGMNAETIRTLANFYGVSADYIIGFGVPISEPMKEFYGLPAGGNRIPYEERAVIYEAAIKHYGRANQMTVAIEEMSEVIKELTKMLRGDGNRDHLAEEIADATIMLEQMRIVYGINAEVAQWMDRKVERLKERVDT